MSEKLFSSLSLLTDSIEGTNLLLEYFSDFSKRIYSARDFKSILQICFEELRKIYISQHIEVIIWHNSKRLVKFVFDEQTGQVVPAEEFQRKNTLYNYVLEKRQIVLTNNYITFCDNLNLADADLPASAWLGIPMLVRGKVLGALIVWEEKPEHYLRVQDKQFLTTITDMIGFAIENLYLYDYIVEKNGSYKIFETVLPKGASGYSAKSVLNQLLQAILKQHAVCYSGIFIRNRFHQTWRLLNETYRQETLARLGVDLLGSLPAIPESLFSAGDPIYWHQQYNNSPVRPAIQDVLPRYQINAALIFPFSINQTYLGIWLIGFQREPAPPTEDEHQLYRFIFYILTQLLEKKALIERKRKYETYMKHLERMKMAGELASGAAHHLNNILSVIMGKTQMLQRRLQHTPYARDLELILRAAEDGATSIQRLQNLVSRNAGTPGKKESVNVNELIQEVVEIARPRFEREAQSRGIHYDLKLTLGRVRPVLAEPASLREVLLNLVNNALDAMPGGGVLSIQSTCKDNKVLIFVSDTGVGIPENVRERIFEPFFTTKGERGNGLGLSIAADIIQRHRGKIYVDSIPNKGSIFMIELPVSGHVQSERTRTDSSTQTMPYKILLVDDEGIVRETLAEMLEEEGCEVTTASNAEEALLKFQKYQCDVILTDLSMPSINGIQLAEKLKQLNPALPVFIITGWNQIDQKLLSSNKVIDGVIKKPFNIEKIRSEIERVLSRSNSVLHS